MNRREIRYRQVAIAYLVYGILYRAGAIYLAGQGIGTLLQGFRFNRHLQLPSRRTGLFACE